MSLQYSLKVIEVLILIEYISSYSGIYLQIYIVIIPTCYDKVEYPNNLNNDLQ